MLLAVSYRFEANCSSTDSCTYYSCKQNTSKCSKRCFLPRSRPLQSLNITQLLFIHLHRGARPKGWSVESAAQLSLLNTQGPGWQGMHAENSLCLTLFALICWDSINAAATATTETTNNSSTNSNSSVYSTYRAAAPALWQPVTQLSPQVESICQQVEAGDAPLLIRRTWSQHYGELCTGLNWNLLSGRQQYQQQQQQGDDESDSTNAATATTSTDSEITVDVAGAEPFCVIAECIGPRVLGAIVRILAGNYWAWRHGLPDLFLWRHSSSSSNDDTSSSSVSTGDRYSSSNLASSSSSSNGHSGSRSSVHNSSSNSSFSSVSGSCASQCVFAEVKGPGDSLSHAQSAWIDKLLAAGASVELVKVEKAAGAFVQPTTSDVQMDCADDTAAVAAAEHDEDDIDSGELD
jgi:VRR-NUC domain